MPECSVVRKSWGELTTDELYSILKLRTDIFFVEQRIDEEELDNRDQEPSTEHLWIEDEAGCVAYLRILVDRTASFRDARRLIGRVVVREDRRGEGLAQELMRRAINSYGGEPLLLHAQQYIAPLYTKFGFEAFGEPYLEASIPHLTMYRPAGIPLGDPVAG
ncbi:MAG TPA: GNAT family N-acetyltransferase [Lacisediminihabitans sp.]|uniref:GNAT family N-acetyltransferase n=1 Tax=Lacisediminihabitans sp. TaxID=2787631 RepID=UPI002EDA3E13